MATNLRAAASPDVEAAFEVKGTVSSLTVLRLRCADVARIAADLAARVVPFPQIFQHAPVVVDVSALDGAEVAWAGLVRALRDVKLVPVGVAGAAPAEVERSGLGQVQLGARLRSSTLAPLAALPAAGAQRPEAPAPPPAAIELRPMVVDKPVRGGQVVYARGVDLIVISSVNPGAQVIADGSIQVWGPLRGRALAGAQGRKESKILCESLEAELVSVNGEYVMAEEIPDALRGQPAQIFLDGERVKIAPL